MADPIVGIVNGVPTSGTGTITTLGQTLLDGANITYGASTDLAVTAGAAGSVSAKLRSISRDIVGGIVLQAGANVIGAVTQSGGPWSVSGTLAATQSGTWNITNITGTISLPTGAATAANQPTNAAIASTTSGQTGHLAMGATSTAAPSYTTSQTNPLSLTPAGALRVDGSGVTQTVSGTVAISGGSIGITGTVPVSQSGTWTVQPGNTANTTPWLMTVNAGGNSATVSAAGALKVDGSAVTQPISAGALPLPSGAATSANQATAAAQGSATAGQTGTLVQGAVGTSAPTYTNGNTNPISLTTAGAIRVDGSGVTQPVSGTVTANQGGTWLTRTQDGSGNAISSTSGSLNVNITGGAGSGGTSSNFSATFPTTGTAAGAEYLSTPPSLTNGQMVALQTNVSGSLKVDGSAVTQPVSGTFWQATQPVSGTIAATQSGAWNITNVTGTISLPTGASTSANQPSNASLGSTTSGQTGTVSLGAVTTGAPSYTTATSNALSLTTAGALRVDGSGVTQPISGSVSISGTVAATQSGTWNITNISGTVSLPTGAATSANQPSNATLGSTTTGQTGHLALGAVTTAAPSYTTATSNAFSLTTAGALRTDASATIQPVSGTVTASQGGTWTVQPGNTANSTPWLTSISQGGNTAAVTASSALKVDGSAVTQPISGTITANQGGNWTSRTVGNAGAILDFAGQNVSAPANAFLVGGEFNTTPTTITSGNASPLQLDSAGNLLVNIKAGAGSGGTAAADESTFTAGSSNFTPSGGFYQASANSNPLTAGQQGTMQLTAYRALQVNLRDANSNQLGVSGSPLFVIPSLPSTQSSVAWTSATALNTTVAVIPSSSAAYNTLQGQLTQGTTITGGAVTFEETFDNGTVWKAVPAGRLIDPSTGAQIANPYTLVANTNLAWQIVSTGSAQVRVRLSTVIAGTGTVTIYYLSTPNLNELVAYQNNAANLLCTASQGGTWNINNISGTISLPTGAATSANQPSNAAQGSTTSGQTGALSMGAVTTSNPSYTTGQTSPISLDTSGAVRVNVIAGSGGGGTSSSFGSSFPATGTAIGGQYLTSPPTLTTGQMNGLLLSSVGRLVVDGSGVTQPVSGTITANQGGAPWTMKPDGTAWALTGTSANVNLTNASVAVTGTFWQTTQPVSAASLPLPTGAATSANQPTAAAVGSTSSGQIGNVAMGFTTTGAPTYTTAQTNPLSLTTAGGLRVDGSATTQPVSGSVSITGTATVTGTVTANQGGAPWSMKPDGTTWAMTSTSANVNLTNASVAVTGTFWQATQPVSAASLPLPTGAATSANQPTNAAAASTTSGQTGGLALGAVTTAAPSYTTATSNYLSLTTAGALRVDGSAVTQPVSGTFWQATQPVSGTVTANQGGTWNVTNISGTISLPTGASTSANQPSNAGQGSTTSGQTGTLGMGAVTTGSPSYTTAQTSPFSLTTAGALRVDGSAVTQPVSGTVAVTQSGTWTVQPGNTANTTAWLVTGTGGVFPASQSGTWNITNVSGTVSLPTGASTSANQPSNATQGSTTSGQTGNLGMGAVTTSAPSYTTAQTSPLSLTTTGGLRVDLTGTGANTTALKVDGSAVTQPVSVAAAVTVQQATAANLKGQVDPLTAANWGIGSSTQNSASVANGVMALAQFNTSPTAITSGNMSPLQMDGSGNLLVNIKAGAGSGGTAAQDAAAFTAGTTNYTPAGGFFQTTATNNALTNGQGGAWQMTANRAGFVNLRTATGIELGSNASPLWVYTPSPTQGTGSWTSVTTLNSVISMLATTFVTYNTIVGQLTQGTTLTGGAVTFEESYDGGTNYKTIPVSRLIDPVTGSQLTNPYTFVASTNQAFQIIATGATNVRARLSTVIAGTGTVAVQSDLTTAAHETLAFQNNAANFLCTASQGGTWTSRCVGNGGGVFDFASTQNIATPGQAILIGGEFNTTPTTITSGNSSPLQLDSAGNVLVNIKSTVNQQCVGEIASGTTDSGNPQKIGGLAKTANPTAVSDGQRVTAIFDKLGKQVVVGALRDLKKLQTTTITTTTETTIVTAGSSGVFNDIYGLTISNTSGTAVNVAIKDSTAGTTRMTVMVPAGDMRGFTVPVDSAMVQATAANNWTATVSAAASSIFITALYVQCT